MLVQRLSCMFKAIRINLMSGRHWADISAFDKNCVSKESKISDVLKRALPGVTYISVQDVSGGCGAMFEVNIEAKEFAGLSIVKQHRLVTDSLKQEIQQMHGIRIHTAVPKDDTIS